MGVVVSGIFEICRVGKVFLFLLILFQTYFPKPTVTAAMHKYIILKLHEASWWTNTRDELADELPPLDVPLIQAVSSGVNAKGQGEVLFGSCLEFIAQTGHRAGFLPVLEDMIKRS